VVLREMNSSIFMSCFLEILKEGGDPSLLNQSFERSFLLREEFRDI